MVILGILLHDLCYFIIITDSTLTNKLLKAMESVTRNPRLLLFHDFTENEYVWRVYFLNHQFLM